MSALGIVAALSLAAAPKPAPLPALPAPLGQVGNVVQPVPERAPSDQDRVVVTKVPGCPSQAVFPLHMLASTIRAAEQVDGWLGLTKGLEAKLFGKAKGTIGGLVAQLRTAAYEPKRECGGASHVAGFKLKGLPAPTKWCPVPADAADGTFWFFSGGKPAATVFVNGGEAPACRARLSALLYDGKGTPRLAVHADWGGAMSAELFGDRCQVVVFDFVPEAQEFRARLSNACAK